MMSDVYLRIPLILASLSMFSVGSDPMLRKQIIGLRLSDSPHIASMSKITDSAYFAPSDCAM